MSEINSEVKNIIEAALLVAGQALTLERMQAMFPEDSRPNKEELREVLKALAQEYEARGIELKQIDKTYRLQTREKYTNFLSRLVEERPVRYSRALLETLAIIAYRQPVTRADIESIRGVGVSTDIIRALSDRLWIQEVGRKEVPGRPALYGTTREFLEYFNLTKLEDLPPLAELRDIAAITAEVDARLQGGAASSPDGDASASSGNGDDTNDSHAEGNGNGSGSGHLDTSADNSSGDMPPGASEHKAESAPTHALAE